MNAPQITYCVLALVSLLISAHNHGKQASGRHNFLVTFLGILIQVGIMWWGGFFG